MFQIIRLERFRPAIRALNELSTTARVCDKSDDENARNKNRKAAVSKLQDLLAKIATENVESKSKAVESAKPLRTSHPVKRVQEKRPIYKIKIDKIPDKHTAQLVAAVKDVADHVGGSDIKATESELLHVILNNKRPEGKEAGELKLENVISGMQVEREETRAAQVRSSMPAARTKRLTPSKGERRSETLDLFIHKPLSIFPPDFRGEPASYQLTTWSNMADKELRQLVTHPPTNIYEEMIRWTERGQLWTFPVDNEQGLEEEKKVDFTQHVFLEEHLEPWCPSKGPIRHFMELVLVGLSKNPYITVESKIENIHWFRDYFESKKKLLEDVGALPAAEPRKEIPASLKD